jgi:hypothetical protein
VTKELVQGAQDLGKRLSSKHRRFVDYIALDGQTGAEACRSAGYAKESARQTAWRLLQREDVRAYYSALMSTRRLYAGAVGLSVLEELATSSSSDNVKRQAASDLLQQSDRHEHRDGGRGSGGGAFSVTINLGNDDEPRVIESTGVPEPEAEQSQAE